MWAMLGALVLVGGGLAVIEVVVVLLLSAVDGWLSRGTKSGGTSEAPESPSYVEAQRRLSDLEGRAIRRLAELRAAR